MLRADASCSFGRRNRRTPKKTGTSTIANHGVRAHWGRRSGRGRLMGVLSGSVRREVAPLLCPNGKPLDAFPKTVKTNRSRFIDRRARALMQDVDLPQASDPCSFRLQFYPEQLSPAGKVGEPGKRKANPTPKSGFMFSHSRGRDARRLPGVMHMRISSEPTGNPTDLRHHSNDIPGRFWIPRVFDTASFDSSGIL